jgi:hypothetical protein
MRKRWTSAWTAPAIGVLLVLTATACGSGGGDGGVASLGSDNSSSSNDTAKKAKKDPEEAAREFAQCMREHGIDMPDPKVSTDGKGGAGFTIQGPVAGADSAPAGSSDQFKTANKECQKHLEGVVNGGDGKGPSKDDIEKVQKKALAFAKCMRKHGVDFPDPQFSGNGGMVQIGGPDQNFDPSDPNVRSATEACQKQAGLPAPKNGDGSFNTREAAA